MKKCVDTPRRERESKERSALFTRELSTNHSCSLYLAQLLHQHCLQTTHHQTFVHFWVVFQAIQILALCVFEMMR